LIRTWRGTLCIDNPPTVIAERVTAGLVAQWLRMEFTELAFRDGFDCKSQKFVFPEQRNDPRLRL
jgi:hypothetical protein